MDEQLANELSSYFHRVITKLATLAVVLWNKSCPSGTEVILTDDFGKEHHTKTRSEAWLAGEMPVVMVEGRTGGYLLTRIRPVKQ